MKALLFAAFSLVMALSTVDAQTILSTTPAAITPGLVVGRQTGNSREWLKVEMVADKVAGAVTRTNRAFVELATGMSYSDGQQWVASDPTFNTTTNGFEASRMQHKVRLANNINGLGIVTLVTPDGEVLRSTPIGIGLYDAASGRSLIIGETRDSQGSLVDSNRVVYANAFAGVCADVIYTIRSCSFEQDVVITGRLNPADYGFPTNTTRIQIFSEFYGTVPEPDVTRRPLWVEPDKTVRSKMASPDLIDESLAFGQMVLPTGRAASYATLVSDPAASAAPVAKEFLTTTDGRTVLVESVQYSWIAKDVLNLPDCQIAPVPSLQSAIKDTSKAVIARLPSRIRATSSSASLEKPKTQLTAVALSSRPGVAVDYIATIGSPVPMVFMGDTTYLVTGPVVCNGATTIEGGAVFKFKYLTPTASSISFNSTVTCKTSRYRPAIFTSVDDDSVGETMNGYSNSGYTGTNNPSDYANPAIQLNYGSGTTLSNLRFTRCREAVRVMGTDGMTATVAHSQLVDCIRGIVTTGDGCNGSSGGSSGLGITLTADNLLFSRVQYPLTANYTSSGTVRHCTVDQAFLVVSNSGYNYYPPTYTFVNCIFANSTNFSSGYFTSLGGNYNGSYNNGFSTFGSAPVNPSGQPFQNSGSGGSYYLVPGHSFKGVGTTAGISTTLLNELKLRTTDPPLYLSAVGTTLSSTVAGNIGIPDLGYHYARLDYVLTNVTLSTPLTLDYGVAIGLAGSLPVLNLQSGASISSVGSPVLLNEIVSVANVQEQPVVLGGSTLMTFSSGTGSSIMDFRFTDFSIGQGTQGTLISSGGNPFSRVSFKDSAFHNTTLTLYPGSTASATVAFTNNLLERCKLSVGQSSAGVTTPFEFDFYNNLMTGDPNSTTPGTPPALALNFDSAHYTSAWEIHDNLFDKATQTVTPNSLIPSSVHLSNNGFTSGTTRGLTGTSDQTGFGLVYQTSSLGSYYLPGTATQLINQGSRSATVAGLYHYTTQTSQAKETSSVVDIGFHYVAVNGSGTPIDSDSDGMPDYLEDTDGNGSYNAGDLGDWQTANSISGSGTLLFPNGLKLLILEPKPVSQIP